MHFKYKAELSVNQKKSSLRTCLISVYLPFLLPFKAISQFQKPKQDILVGVQWQTVKM